MAGRAPLSRADSIHVVGQEESAAFLLRLNAMLKVTLLEGKSSDVCFARM
jgi:hypothetical protein